ncbi:MAG: hypothetical protein NC388_03585 [Clostridium sp.]|nr:hypothetical protein [Clostridium sp.]
MIRPAYIYYSKPTGEHPALQGIMLCLLLLFPAIRAVAQPTGRQTKAETHKVTIGPKGTSAPEVTWGGEGYTLMTDGQEYTRHAYNQYRRVMYVLPNVPTRIYSFTNIDLTMPTKGYFRWYKNRSDLWQDETLENWCTKHLRPARPDKYKVYDIGLVSANADNGNKTPSPFITYYPDEEEYVARVEAGQDPAVIDSFFLNYSSWRLPNDPIQNLSEMPEVMRRTTIVLKHASARYNAMREKLENHRLMGELEALDAPEQCFLESHDVTMPLGVTTFLRLNERLENYFISIDQGYNSFNYSAENIGDAIYLNNPKQVRWRVYDENKNMVQETIKTHQYGANFRSNVYDNDMANLFKFIRGTTTAMKRRKWYVTAEGYRDNGERFPLSCITVTEEPYTNLMTEQELASTDNPNLRSRRKEEIEKDYTPIYSLDFNGSEEGAILDALTDPKDNYRTTTMDLNSTYIYGDISSYDVSPTGEPYTSGAHRRAVGSRSVCRSEYAFYRSLNHPGISTGGQGYNDWFTQNSQYPVQVHDREYERSGGQKYGYFMYLDASDETGTIVDIPMQYNLCPDARMLVTAWICNLRSNVRAAANQTDADLGITFKGIDEEGNEHVLHTFYTGKARNIPTHDEAMATPGQLEAQWQQICFMFTFSDKNNHYKNYVLSLLNNGEHSNGADYGIDDIRVYLAKSNVEVQRNDNCGTSDIKLASDHSRLLAAFNLTANSTVVSDEELNAPDYSADSRLLRFGLSPRETNLFFLFADKNNNKLNDIRYNGLESNMTDYGRVVFSTNIEDLPLINSTLPDAERQRQIESISLEKNRLFLTQYKSWWNTLPEDEKSNYIDPNDISNPQTLFNLLNLPPIHYAYRLTEDVENGHTDRIHLTNFSMSQSNANLKVGETYQVVLFRLAESKDYDTVDPADECAIRSDFQVGAGIVLTMTTESNVEEEFCLHNELKVTARLKDAEANEIEPEEAYNFDWYIGPKDEADWQFTYVKDSCYLPLSKRTIYLKEALERFHAAVVSPDLFGDLGNWNIPERETDDRVTKDYLTRLSKEGRLLLNTKDYTLTLHNRETYIIAIPYVVDEYREEWEKILCLEPTEFKIQTSPHTPTAWLGERALQGQYAEGYVPSVRMGLKDVQNCRKPDNGDAPILRLPIRDVDMYAIDGCRLDISQNGNQIYDEVKLYATTDPTHTMYKYTVVGNVRNIHCYVDEDNDGHEDYVEIAFNDRFIPQEGYIYELLIPYQEFNAEGESTEACTGELMVPLKIVPEYLTWTDGENNGEWNHDRNWKRSSEAEVYMGRQREDQDANPDVTSTRTDGLANAFAPMSFTKVTVVGKGPRLYGLADVNGLLQLKPEAGDSIEYDLCLKNPDEVKLLYPDQEGNKRYQATFYYGNTCKEIYFKAGSDLCGQQHLNYINARVDIELNNYCDYWLSSPLRAVYAGDMYSPDYEQENKGRQTTPAFSPILYDEKKNNRFNPAYYQRAWNKSVTVFTPLDEQDKTGNGTPLEYRAVASEWSVDYNDVATPYAPGKGFYARMEMGDDANTDKALLRLPKDDNCYFYQFSRTRGNGGEILDRTGAGRLIDGNPLVVELPAADATDQTYTNDPDGDGRYYLVGNPYMAPLDMQVFFAQNPALFPTFRTLEDGTQVVSHREEDGTWLTNGTGDQATRVRPLQAFFVELDPQAQTPHQITFTPEMMATEGGTTNAGRSEGLMFTASRNGRHHSALIARRDRTGTDYDPHRDASLLIDPHTKGDTPLVYTVTGQRMTSLSSMAELNNVPIGVYNVRGEEVALTIEGMAQWDEPLYLFDAQTGDSTPLTGDSHTIRLIGSSHGRYFLRNRKETVEASTGDDIQFYSPEAGSLIIAASVSLKKIEVYTPNGTQTCSLSPDSPVCKLSLQRGTYIVKAITSTERQYDGKVIVR